MNTVPAMLAFVLTGIAIHNGYFYPITICHGFSFVFLHTSLHAGHLLIMILASSKILHHFAPEDECFIIQGQYNPLSIRQVSPSGTSISTVIFTVSPSLRFLFYPSEWLPYGQGTRYRVYYPRSPHLHRIPCQIRSPARTI